MNLRQLKLRAKELGATVEDDKSGQSHECRVEAPHGKIWICDGVHELVDVSYRPWKPDYADLLNRMSHGLRNCEDAECDWCESR